MNAKDDETLIPLSEVPNLPWLPRKRHLATIYRWATVGRRGAKLRTIYATGICTTPAWVWDFFEASTGRNPKQPPSRTTPSERRRAHERAENALDAAGIK